MSDETLRTLILALLGTGGAGFIYTLGKTILAFRNSAESREDKAVARLERYEEDCRRQLTWEREWGAYWNRRAATLERILLVEGLPVPPPENLPSEEPQ